MYTHEQIEEVRSRADGLFDAAVFGPADGQALRYRYHRAPGAGAPLALLMHGSGSIGDDNRAQLFLAGLFCRQPHSDWRNWNILAPQCPEGQAWVDNGGFWSGERYRFRPDTATPSLAAVRRLLEECVSAWQADERRVFVGGCSMGGYAVWELVARSPGFFAGAFPICGGCDLAMAPLVKDTSLRIFHGGLDEVVLPGNSRAMYAELRRLGARDVAYVEYPGVRHDAWLPAMAEDSLQAWLQDTRRPADRT